MKKAGVLAPTSPELPFHRYANLFSWVEGWAEFVADLKANGVHTKVWLIKEAGETFILDGRNRVRGAREAGVPVEYDTYAGTDPLGFVVSLNLRRRHLNESQRGYAAALIERRQVGRPKKKPADENATDGQPEQPEGLDRDAAAKLLNVSARTVAAAAKVLEKGSEELKQAVKAGKLPVSQAAQAITLEPKQQRVVITEISAGNAKTAKQVIKRGRRADRDRRLADRVTKLPERKFCVFMADPEWHHVAYSGKGYDRAAAMHYPVSDNDVIKNRPVQDIAFEGGAAMYLWTTAPHLKTGMETLEAWGFNYVSHVIWWKIYPGNKTGMGAWSRIEHELLLIGTRGKISCVLPGEQITSVQRSPVGRHSEKPEWAYRMVESYHRDLFRRGGLFLEMNARPPRKRGWCAWGDEMSDCPEADVLAAEALEPTDELTRALYLVGEGRVSEADDRAVELAREKKLITHTRGRHMQVKLTKTGAKALDIWREQTGLEVTAAEERQKLLGCEIDELADGDIPAFLRNKAAKDEGELRA